jgi:elongation factor Ts
MNSKGESLEISTTTIKELRDKTGAGIMDCQKALSEAEGDLEKASQILKERRLFAVQKKAGRATREGLVEAYVHTGGRIGALVEVNCETDFVARNDAFKELAHNLAMQVAAQDPQFISEEEVPDGTDCEPEVSCLLLQPYIRDPGIKVKDIIAETIAKFGENIRVSRFARFELGG